MENNTHHELFPESHINVALSRLICLILFSTLLGPSVLLAFYVFYCLFRMPEIRNRLTNHIIITIFLISFIQVNIYVSPKRDMIERFFKLHYRFSSR